MTILEQLESAKLEPDQTVCYCPRCGHVVTKNLVIRGSHRCSVPLQETSAKELIALMKSQNSGTN